MTTRVIVLNDHTSNPMQHTLVKLHSHPHVKSSAVEEHRLAPGESIGIWLHAHEKVELSEILEPKPKS